MRRLRNLALVCGIAGAGFGATCQQAKQDAKVVLTESVVACAIANAALDNDTLMKVCAVEAELAPVIVRLLGVKRAAERGLAPACSSSK